MSEWKEEASRRRNQRQAPATGEARHPARVRKNHKWCRGKPGVEHVPVTRPYDELHPSHTSSITRRWYEVVCSSCGKVLKRVYPWSPAEDKAEAGIPGHGKEQQP